MGTNKNIYFRTILDMKDEKFEIFDAAQKAGQKMRELRESNPEFFDLLDSVQSMLSSLRPIYDLMKPFKEVQEAIEGYVRQRLCMAKDIEILPFHGWYFSMWFIDCLEIKDIKLLLLENPGLFETEVINLFERQLNTTIRERLIESFPKRTQIINEILSSHASKNYLSSIPLALMQADGFCKDVFFHIDKNGKRTPIGFFNLGKKNNSRRAQILSETLQVPETSVFNILTNQLAKSDRNLHLLHEANTTRLSDLNRHAILHGESINYGTYINSVKAILLLDFITDLKLMSDLQNDSAKGFSCQ
jgi:hypothetical protein